MYNTCRTYMYEATHNTKRKFNYTLGYMLIETRRCAEHVFMYNIYYVMCLIFFLYFLLYSTILCVAPANEVAFNFFVFVEHFFPLPMVISSPGSFLCHVGSVSERRCAIVE